VTELRRIFDEDASLYDRMRPRYPDDLVDDLVQLTGITRDSRVLEIGVGTGQLTAALAERGCEMVGLEIGPRLAERARVILQRFPRVEIATVAFEEWRPPATPFDVVVAATAFHWLDPAVRIRNSAAALRPGGALAIVSTHHVAGGSSDFFVDVQECYERWDPATEPGLRLPAADEIPHETEELEASPLFEVIAERRYERALRYTTTEYRDLLLTYSGHRALDKAARTALLDCIATLIDARHGGRVTKAYLHQLIVARHLS
jgi:SAM-dependent methyltransferase